MNPRKRPGWRAQAEDRAESTTEILRMRGWGLTPEAKLNIFDVRDLGWTKVVLKPLPHNARSD
jgi:hypothetical protein